MFAFFGRSLETGKWLLASMLLVNGGSIAALLSNEKYGAALLAICGVPFTIGIVLALISGMASWAASDSLAMMLRLRLRLQLVETEKTSQARKTALMWGQGIYIAASVAAFATLLGSGIAFASGALGAAGYFAGIKP